MPRFFFHIRSGDQSLSVDELGLDFPNVETALDEAVRAAHGLEEMFAARGEEPRHFSLEVESASGEIVARLRFSDIFSRRADPVAFPSRDTEDGHCEQDRTN